MAAEKKTPLQAIVEAWKEIRFAKADYPPGLPVTLPLDDSCVVALLADWGGDNPAAKRIAGIVQHAQPKMAIHLGDIYYGGVKEECEAFLRNWPMQIDPAHPGHGVPPGSSFALNGNHEMYSGGEAFFNVVLPALGQPQPFFCLEASRRFSANHAAPTFQGQTPWHTASPAATPLFRPGSPFLQALPPC